MQLPAASVVTTPSTTASVNDPSSTPAETAPHPNKKQKKTPTADKKVKATNVNTEKKPYTRGKVALKAYWDDLARLAPDMPVETLKQALLTLRKVAVIQLKQKGKFLLHGVCEMRIRNLKGRPPTKALCFGKEIKMKEKPPTKRVYAKCLKDLSDCVVKEDNA